MKEDLPDIHEDAYHSDIYFALSWQSGFGERSAWNVVQILDQAAFRAIGDIKLPGKIDEDRIRRIMRDCSGFVCVLPFRGNSWTTSEWMFPEIRIAAEMKIPVIFFHEKNVDIQIERADMQTTVSFPGFQDSEKIDFQSKFYGPFPLEEDARQRDEMVRVQLQAFLEVCDHEENKKKPYAFFITRVQDDFMQARRAVETAVYNEAGLACIWTEPGRYSDHNNQQFQVQIKKLIKNAVFVIADLSFSNNNP
ncbi:MAG: hypothetical protein ABIQ93_14200, partial [Saprospiraceae bacterium]